MPVYDLFPGDAIIYSGLEISPTTSARTAGQTLLYNCAFPITIYKGDQQLAFYSSAATLGEAL
jgi:hypothetical protein